MEEGGRVSGRRVQKYGWVSVRVRVEDGEEGVAVWEVWEEVPG